MNAPNQAETNSFSDRMIDILNGSMLSLMIGIGYKTDLFETMTDLPPSTSEEIAQAAGLKERYVREWLAAMVVGRIIDHDPATGHYHLPSEHAAALTRAAGADNMARLALVVPSLASVQEDIIAAFFQGAFPIHPIRAS